jgi:hypothetical protein
MDCNAELSRFVLMIIEKFKIVSKQFVRDATIMTDLHYIIIEQNKIGHKTEPWGHH